MSATEPSSIPSTSTMSIGHNLEHEHEPDGSNATSSTLPRKRILSKQHLEAFQASETHKEVLDFVLELNESIIGKKLSEVGEVSPAVQSILHLLDEIDAIAESVPPVDNSGSRFGNPAFKTFYDKLQNALPSLHEKYIVSATNGRSPVSSEIVPELCVYLGEAWGNRTRIDYGSGMELNFVCWLLCLRKLGFLKAQDDTALVLKVFWRYIAIMRRLQSTYWLEPAGSHGVWGLDDYHFLPFLWGSGQLSGHKHLKPKVIHDSEILEAFASEYMYLASVQFINSIKTASLSWHSPMLNDISAVKTWAKVNEGMIKMYKAEVLGKLPVVQHFLFGTLLPFPEGVVDDSDVAAEEDEHGHIHGAKEAGWSMDCCGISVPSAFGAAQAAQAAANGPGATAPVPGLLKPRGGIRPIPFD